MANDLFGGLGGLVKGLSNFIPQDNPAAKLLGVQSEVGDLKKQEAELYAEIGKQAVSTYGIEAFGELSNKLKLVQSNLASAEEKLRVAKSEQEEKEKAEKAAAATCTCASCGHENPEGTKFCQECGAKLGAAGKAHCTSCGAGLAPGTRFCGECGARQSE